MKKTLLALLLCLTLLSAAVCGSAEKAFPAAAADYADAMGQLLTDLFGFSYEWQQNTLDCGELIPISVFAGDNAMLQTIVSEVTVNSEETEALSETLQRFGLSIAVMTYSWRYLALDKDMTALTAEAPAISESLAAISGMGLHLEPQEDGSLTETALIPAAGVTLKLCLTLNSETGEQHWQAALTFE